MDKSRLCMGSFLTSATAPSPTLSHSTDDRLTAGLDRDVFDPNHLLVLAAVAVEGVSECRERAYQLVAIFQTQLAAGEGLLGQGGPVVTLEGRLMGRHHLHGQHGLDRVMSADVGDPAQGRRVTDLLGIGIFLATAPDRAEDLVGGIAGSGSRASGTWSGPNGTSGWVFGELLQPLQLGEELAPLAARSLRPTDSQRRSAAAVSIKPSGNRQQAAQSTLSSLG